MELKLTTKQFNNVRAMFMSRHGIEPWLPFGWSNGTLTVPEALADEIQAMDADDNSSYLAEQEANSKLLARATVRAKIDKKVGDTASLVGTVADGAGLLIAIALADVVALSSNTTFAAYRTAKLDTLKALAGDADIAVLASAALAQIQSGDMVLTASLKGLESVINESLTRSTAVAAILSQAD